MAILFTIHEAGSRSDPRLRALISSKMWIFVPELHFVFLFGLNILIESHFMLFLRKMRKCADLNSTPCIIGALHLYYSISLHKPICKSMITVLPVGCTQ